MKKELLLACFFVCLFAPLAAESEQPAMKYYCNAEQIEITDDMILIHLTDITYELDALLVDQGGIYFTDDMLRCTYCRRPSKHKNICECPRPCL